MSVYYEVKEHLQVRRNQEDGFTGAYVALGAMKGQLAALAALILTGENASVYDLHLTADGKKYSFKGNEITPEYKEILTALTEAADVDLAVSFGFTWRSNWNMYELVGPFPLMNRLEDPEYEDLDWSGVFYSAWEKEDSTAGTGKLVVYKEKDGKIRRRDAVFEAAPAVPDGIWYGQDSPVYAKGDPGDPAFVKACKALSDAFGQELDLETEKGDYYGDYYLKDNITLHNDTDARRFVELLTDLKAAASEFDLTAIFVDYTTTPDARLLEIEDMEDGPFVTRLAQI